MPFETLPVEEQICRLTNELVLIRAESDRLSEYMKQYSENSNKHSEVYKQIQDLMLLNSKFKVGQRVKFTDEAVEKKRAVNEAKQYYMGDVVKYKGRACYVHKMYFYNDLTVRYFLTWEGKTTGKKTNFAVYNSNGWPENCLEDFPKKDGTNK